MGALAGLLHPGCRVGVADGASSPRSAFAELSSSAAAAGGVELLLGWMPAPIDGLDITAFASAGALMGGYALRAAIDAGLVSYVPARLGAAPALLHGPLRCDVLVASVGRVDGGYRLLTEVAWMRAAVDAGAVVVAVERPLTCPLDAGPPIGPEHVIVIASSRQPPAEVRWAAPTDVHHRLARHVVTLVPAGARVQYAPGPVGTAVLDALDVPVHIDTGMITDAVADLDRRRLLLGRPVAPYVAGGADLYDWSVGRVDADRVERTHDPSRLAGDPPLVAVNTALEVDLDGQVNVEAVGGSTVAGIGGQPDYAGAAARSPRGLSIVAVPTMRGSHRTLVERLAAPASTPAHDVDVMVTERGAADLRGLDRAARCHAIAALWE